MLKLIVLCVIYSTVTLVLTSDTPAEVLIPDSTDECEPPTTTLEDMENNTISIFTGKHELLQNCVTYPAEHGEYEIFENGSIYVTDYNKTLNESLYFLIKNTACTCFSFLSDNVAHDIGHINYADKGSYFWYFSQAGFVTSIFSLLVHLAIFAMVPELKNLPGCNLAALCFSLLCSYFFLFLIGTEKIAQYQNFCIATAFVSHFFLLASFFWMFVMSCDVFVSLLRVTGSFRASGTNFTYKRFGIYCLCSFGTALLFAIASLLADTVDNVPEQFKPKYKTLCWFTNKTALAIFFAIPALILTCLNFIFFGLSALILHCNKMNQPKEDRKSILKGRYFMYFRLSVVMGVTWIAAVFANIANVSWLWFIFMLLNTLHGLFILIAFTCCNKKVKKYFREKYFGARRSSEQSLTPTFVSYYSYDNPAHENMDNGVGKGIEMKESTSVPD